MRTLPSLFLIWELSKAFSNGFHFTQKFFLLVGLGLNKNISDCVCGFLCLFLYIVIWLGLTTFCRRTSKRILKGFWALRAVRFYFTKIRNLVKLVVLAKFGHFFFRTISSGIFVLPSNELIVKGICPMALSAPYLYLVFCIVFAWTLEVVFSIFILLSAAMFG